MSAALDAYGSFSYQKTFQTEVKVVGNSAWDHPYQSDFVVPKMEQSIAANPTSMHQAAQSPRFLLGNAANFQSVEPNYYERPLLMDAWAQTTLEDFGLICDEHRDRVDYLQKENEALREKVHLLENELRVHSDLLNQIHATAALKTKARESIEHISATPPATPVMNNNVKYDDASQYQNSMQRISPANYTATQSHAPQVMNSVQGNGHGVCLTTTENVNYTIKYVSNTRDIHENQSVEPIEIQLAEEDGALNLNSSADSGRLEICLGEHEANQTQEAENFKAEVATEEHTLPPLPAQSGILVKRRRVNSQSQAVAAQTEHQGGKPLGNQDQNMQGYTVLLPEQLTPDILSELNCDRILVSIGPNNTRIPLKLYQSINFDCPSLATRKLLMALFDRNTLATHSMTGKPSPAFKNQAKPQKGRLDPRITEDIIYCVGHRSKVSDKEVRGAITTKCADENKMMKQQLNKKNSKRQSNTNKENHNYNAQK